MTRRLLWVTLLMAAAMLTAVLPAAAAPGPFGADQIVVNCSAGPARASIAADGTTHGFATCATGSQDAPIYYFRASPGAPIVREISPWTGEVEATAWDGVDALYVLFTKDGDLWIAKRLSSTGAYSAATLVDGGHPGYFGTGLVASNGKWWAVWSRNIGSGVSEYQQLFQRHTLLGTQGITRITTTPYTITDRNPTLSYHAGTVTLIWTRINNPTASNETCDLRVARSHGGTWASTTLATQGTCNNDAESVDYNGVTYATWTQDLRVVVANDAGGTFVTHTFVAKGYLPHIGVSYGKVFLAWEIAQTSPALLFTQGSGSAWSSSVLTPTPGEVTAVLGQGGKARVLYLAVDKAHLRTQI